VEIPYMATINLKPQYYWVKSTEDHLKKGNSPSSGCALSAIGLQAPPCWTLITVTAPEDVVTTDEGGRLLPHALESSLLQEGAGGDATMECSTLALPPVSGGLSCSVTELANTLPPPADVDFVFPETKAAELVGAWECCW